MTIIRAMPAITTYFCDTFLWQGGSLVSSTSLYTLGFNVLNDTGGGTWCYPLRCLPLLLELNEIKGAPGGGLGSRYTFFATLFTVGLQWRGRITHAQNW
jgi:hypothetical protein